MQPHVCGSMTYNSKDNLSVYPLMNKENPIQYRQTYISKFYSAIKENEISSWATPMDLESIMLGEISRTEKDIPHDLTYMWYLKIIIIKTSSQIKKNKTQQNQIGGCQRWAGGPRKWVERVERYKLSYKISESWEYSVQHGDYRKYYYMKTYTKAAEKT